MKATMKLDADEKELLERGEWKCAGGAKRETARNDRFQEDRVLVLEAPPPRGALRRDLAEARAANCRAEAATAPGTQSSR